MAKAAPHKKVPKAKPSRVYMHAGGVSSYYILLIAVTLLVGISAVMVVSASSNETVLKLITAQSEQLSTANALTTFGQTGLAPYMNGIRNVVFIVVGIVCAWVLSRSNYRAWGSNLVWPVIMVLVLLVLTALFGVKVNGARRWIDVGVSVQASELAKPILLAYVAWLIATYLPYIKSRNRPITEYWPLALVGVSGLLIYTQPDLGTTAIIGAGCVVGYLASGGKVGRGYYIFPIGIAGAFAYIMMSGNYQAGRITSFLSGEPSHQVKQALYALGSGGLIGLGPGLSRQKYYNLPEAQNDFILAIIGEELGFIGSIIVVLGFALILFAGIRIALGCKDKMGRALAAGATAMLVFQGIINMAAVVGIGPVTGKPLPFVTLGGSAMVSAFMLLGVLLSVSRYGAEPCRADARPTSNKPSAPKRSGDVESKRPAKEPERVEKRRTRRPSNNQPNSRKEGPSDDEDSFEWRWDSGAHLPSNRTRS